MKKGLLLALGVLFSASFSACADGPPEIIHDTFSGAKGASIQDRSPDKADIPGGKWSVVGFAAGGNFAAVLDTDATSGTSQAYLACAGNSNGGIAIPFSEQGASVKAQRFHISASFYSTLAKADDFGGNDAFSHFTGLCVAGDGSLSLYRNGGLVLAIPYTGNFDPKEFHKLAYDFDISSGSISNISLQGSTSDYSAFTATRAFTDEATAYAALAALCESGRDNQAYAQDFLITALSSSETPGPAPVAAKPADISSPILIKNGDRIGFMGDSITAQANARKGYVQLVIAGLKAVGVDAVPVPAGHSGDNSRNMLSRVNIDVLHKGANWMTLSCGVNDVELPQGVDLETYKKNVETMFKKTRAWDVRLVILTATPLGESEGNAKNRQLAAYNDFLRTFAAENRLPVTDMNAAFWKVLNAPDTTGAPVGKRLLVDGIHPNEAGQFLMAMTLLQALGVPASEMPRVEQALRDYAQGK
jgi:lysophospholipase L1-like esterase